jgi:cob(I)alamin adenosyltransferase
MGVRLDRIYTRTGDDGSTRLVGGQKVRKDSPRLEAYGTVDELNAVLGLVRTSLLARNEPAGARQLAAIIERIQNELFDLGSDLATRPEDVGPSQPLTRDEHVAALEREIDAWNDLLPPLASFVLPGGGQVAAELHLARTVCRRAERAVVGAAESEAIRPEVLRYLNRLSDALFVMSRFAARLYGEAELLWDPKRT